MSEPSQVNRQGEKVVRPGSSTRLATMWARLSRLTTMALGSPVEPEVVMV